MTSISVIIPTYNREDTISRAIDSVLSQTFKDYELIIVDDGSDDNTREMVKKYENKINLITNSTNLGQNVARNIGLKASNGKYISYLDSDDEFHPNHLEEVYNLLEVLPDNYGGVLTSCRDIYAEDNKLRHTYDGKITKEKLGKGLYRYVAGLTTLTFKSRILKDIDGHDENITSSTDVDFYFQILDEYDIFGLDKVLCNRYKQDNSVSKDANKLEELDGELIKKHGGDLSRFNRSKIRYDRAIALSELGEMKSAFKLFGLCFIDYPFRKKYLYHFILSAFGQRVFERFSLYSRSYEIN